MNTTKYVHHTLTWLIASVWIINGLFCKVLDLVPRHRWIVARILGDEYSGLLTKMIGIAEVCMGIWVLSGVRGRLSAMAQIVLVGTMNILEFFMAPDLLLFGRVNAILALVLMTVVYCNEFFLRPQTIRQ